MLGADLTALEALITTGLARRTGAGTWATDGALGHLAAATANRIVGTDGSGVVGVATVATTLAYSSSALSVGAASDSATGVIEIAVQSEMETATSTTLAVTPGRQHFHPGHPKVWGYATVSGGTPTLETSYNLTSITDTGTGQLTATIATDFSDAEWACIGACGKFGSDERIFTPTTLAARTVLMEARAASSNFRSQRMALRRVGRSSMMRREIIVTTTPTGGVALTHPAAEAIAAMCAGGFWHNATRGFIDTQIERKIARGMNQDAAARLCRALAFGGLVDYEALAIIRDADAARFGTAHELVDLDDIPQDRTYRNAWRRSHNGGPILIDARKAMEIDEARAWREYEALAQTATRTFCIRTPNSYRRHGPLCANGAGDGR